MSRSPRLFRAASLCLLFWGSAAFADDPNVKPDAKADPVVKTAPVQQPAGDPNVEAAAKTDAVKTGEEPAKVDAAASTEIAKHPLEDTARSKEEREALSGDSDAELDRKLGLDKMDDTDSDPGSLGWQLVKTLLMLGVVVGFIYLSLNYGLRKMMGLKSPTAGGKGSVVTLMERVPLEQKRTMYVIKAAGEYLLIGTSESGMNLISKLDTAEVERIQRERGQGGQMPLSPFFQKLLTRKGGPPPQA